MDKNWKRVAKENYESLKNVSPDKASKDQYLLYASSVALLDHFGKKDEDSHTEVEHDPVPSSLIDERMQDKLKLFIEYMEQKGLEQTTGAKLHGEYACEALKKMLALDEEIAEMLYRAADKEEKEMIVAAQHRIGDMY